MFSRDLETQEMLARVAQFGVKHTSLFPINELTGSTFTAIRSELSKISQHAASQLSNKAAGRISGAIRATAREALRKQLERICQTAAAMSINMPEIAGKFRMAERRRDLNLVYSGQSFVKEAEALRKEFVEHRLPEDFIEKLDAAVQDMKAAMLEQAHQKEGRANAGKEIKDTMKTCLTLLQRVDAIVINTLTDKPAIQAEWEVTRRVVRKAAAKPRKPQPKAAANPEAQPDVAPNPEPSISIGAAANTTA